MEDKISDENKAKIFIVGLCNPIHHCVKAFLPTHKCTFALCEDCKTTIENKQQETHGTAKRTRSAVHRTNKNITPNEIKKAFNTKYQNKIGPKKQVAGSECDEEYDHDYRNLTSFSDVSFFDNAFLKQVKTSNRPFPTSCHKCNAQFRKN